MRYPLAIAALASLFAVPVLAQPAADWVTDLDHLARELPRRHATPTVEVDAATFAREVADLRTRLPALDDAGAVAGLMRLAGMFGDGHTEISPLQKATGFTRVPLILYSFENGGMRVIGAAPDQRDLLGARLTQVGGLPTESAVNRLEPLMSGDLGNPHEREHAAPELLLIPELLAATGVTKSAAASSYTFTFDDERVVERTLNGLPVSAFSTLAWVRLLDGREPLRTRDRSHWYAATRLDDGSLYVKIDRSSDQSGMPSLANFFETLQQDLRTTPAPRVVVDLRFNTGGDYNKVKGLVQVLAPSRPPVRVLVARHTYSAAIQLTADLKHRLGAKLIGETPRARPNWQGESESFSLPHSKLVVHYSSKSYRPFPELGAAVELPLDEHVTFTWANFSDGRDPVLEAARR